MGICLSCLKPSDGDQESYDENAPLLNSQQNNYDKDTLLKEREAELNKIVDETNDTNSSLGELATPKPLTGDLQDVADQNELQLKAKKVGIDQLAEEEKNALQELDSHIRELVLKEIKIQRKGPLLVDFS